MSPLLFKVWEFNGFMLYFLIPFNWDATPQRKSKENQQTARALWFV